MFSTNAVLLRMDPKAKEKSLMAFAKRVQDNPEIKVHLLLIAQRANLSPLFGTRGCVSLGRAWTELTKLSTGSSRGNTPFT